jgi:hypothetical protein
MSETENPTSQEGKKEGTDTSPTTQGLDNVSASYEVTPRHTPLHYVLRPRNVRGTYVSVVPAAPMVLSLLGAARAAYIETTRAKLNVEDGPDATSTAQAMIFDSSGLLVPPFKNDEERQQYLDELQKQYEEAKKKALAVSFIDDEPRRDDALMGTEGNDYLRRGRDHDTYFFEFEGEGHDFVSGESEEAALPESEEVKIIRTLLNEGDTYILNNQLQTQQLAESTQSTLTELEELVKEL